MEHRIYLNLCECMLDSGFRSQVGGSNPSRRANKINDLFVLADRPVPAVTNLCRICDKSRTAQSCD